MLTKILAIIVFIIAFAALICIHEAGHFSMAKLFKVYCKEFSIGFGPAIYSKKKKGHETKFSLRWIPLGGYVAMYGEDTEDDDEFKDLPKERSLEHIKKWKKAIIVSAGIILNALLALILIGISNICFRVTYVTRQAVVAENSLISEAGIKENDKLEFVIPKQMEDEGVIEPFTYEFTDNQKLIHAGSFYIVDPNIKLESGERYVLTFMFAGDKKEPVFTDGLSLYKAISKEELSTKTNSYNLFKDWANEEGSPNYYPIIEDDVVTLTEGMAFDANIGFLVGENEEVVIKTIHIQTIKDGKKFVFEDIGLSFKLVKEWLPFKTRLANTFRDYGEASIAVFKGLKVLFTGGIKNLGGFIRIAATSTTVFTTRTFATYLYFWGLISVNLAIFNLLPFPGLDGWQLLVTAIEGITKKKLPSKFKTIMSIIGLALLFALMIVIVVLDIKSIAGI